MHITNGRTHIGWIEDDGTFYNRSGKYLGQIDLNDGKGYRWENIKGYTGFQEGDRFWEEGHEGIPDIYEEGGEGTGGAFHAILDAAEDDDEW